MFKLVLVQLLEIDANLLGEKRKEKRKSLLARSSEVQKEKEKEEKEGSKRTRAGIGSANLVRADVGSDRSRHWWAASGERSEKNRKEKEMGKRESGLAFGRANNRGI